MGPLLSFEAPLRYLFLSLLLTVAPAAADVFKGPARVIDGDSIAIDRQEVRLFGIDAPELDQTCADRTGKKYLCGRRAAFELASWISDSPVTCELTRVDGIRRSIGVCSARNQDLSRWMVARGWAIAFRPISTDYVADERYARERQIGIWEGEFIAPKGWRKGSR